MDVLKRANEIKEEIIANRRYLHQHAEVAHDLPQTVAYVKEKLAEMGIEAKDCGKGGVTAVVGGTKPGKCVLLRADMDALPMKEESGLPFASLCDNAAHTCGHDTHTDMLLGAAKLLKEMEDDLNGCVKFMFQPAEECVSGAKSMIDDGILENPKVDVAAAQHIWALKPTGNVQYAHGPVASSTDMFRIDIQGKGGHGAMPQLSIDPINVGAHIHIALQELLAREVAPSAMAILTIGAFHSGTVGNIIPDSACMRGTIRTMDPEVRAFLNKRLVEVVESTAATYRATATVTIESSTPVLICDKDACEAMGKSVASVLPEGTVQDNYEGLSGSEDFACVGEKVPSVLFILGANPGNREESYGQHHPKVYFDEEAFPTGVATYVQAALAYLK